VVRRGVVMSGNRIGEMNCQTVEEGRGEVRSRTGGTSSPSWVWRVRMACRACR
jgi:hypothetical protein